MASCGGSSPLMRGKRDFVRACDLHGRLIPAHAGKTVPGPARWRVAGAHPRSCGENTRPMGFAAIAAGSSPLMRGKRVEALSEREPPGLIPTHAGKTARSCRLPTRRRAHPHSCGENRPMIAMCAVLLGSSPLTRGKHKEDRISGHGRGLIPAHAGKTHQATCPVPDTRAHPRSCRENNMHYATLSRRLGSSPLTRGKPCDRAADRLPGGLIPAHTGRTCVRYAGCLCSRAHPRSCGENTS